MRESYLYKSDNLEIEFEVNDWAERSLISLLTKSRDTVVMTVINLGQELPQSDFLPLTVDYEEKFYAAGKIFGSRFIRRETKPTITSILNARLIDRSIRPAFPLNFRYQTHIVNTVLSYNPEANPALLALLGTSFALEYLKIPWNGPIAGFKIEDTDKEIFVSGTKNKVNMIEFEGKEIKEKEIIEDIKIAFAEIQKIINFIEESTKKQTRKIEIKQENYKTAEELLAKFLKEKNIDLKKLLFGQEEGDKNWSNIFGLLAQEDFGENAPYVLNVLNKKFKQIFQQTVLEEKTRPDGRKLDDIRPISAQIDVLPRVHGSAIFKRGLTHILSTVTFAAPGEELVLKEIEYEGTKHFMHQYNFPPYSTGEIGSSKGPSRREIGHGELAEKALRSLIPLQEEFPYTIRVVSEVLSSNGSTSMGSVCASSLALMAAGVPIKKHIAGISIGIAYQDDENYELLTDIQGPEDFFGGMDFKVAGTKDGVTAIQLDVKIEGLNFEQIEKALTKAREARLKIIDYMETIIKEPRKEVSPFAPKVEAIKIDPLKIGLVIGTGGKTINEIIVATNTKIDIHPDGLIYISGENHNNVALAKNWIKIIGDSLQIGEIVKGKVIKILPFGAILELAPQKTALLHISEIADKKIESIENEIKIGEELNVSVKQISDDGRIYVSLKDARRTR
ncbi:MAG: polyribonucleotide nucleotidyltransferase [Candidatus Parcubacteria bacterium]|nr:MAG: polyribonucleotide nucleotidyltransferase [Candidatus Parcubacteria bacterium]